MDGEDKTKSSAPQRPPGVAGVEAAPKPQADRRQSVIHGLKLRPLMLCKTVDIKVEERESAQASIPPPWNEEWQQQQGEEDARDAISEGGTIHHEERSLRPSEVRKARLDSERHHEQTEAEREAEADPLFRELMAMAARDGDIVKPPSRAERLKTDIEEYLGQAYLEEVYGDFLSSCRTRVYEPAWPPTPGKPVDYKRPQPPSAPKSKHEANDIFSALLNPLLPWYTLSDEETHTAVARRMQGKIARALDKYQRERGARQWREKIEAGAGGTLLYRNVPDAGRELNVQMLISRTQLALQRKHVNRAERLIEKALLLVTKLDYHPLTAKCWYWKALIADMRQSPAEAAQCLFNALPCVGKYPEGDYLPRYVHVYKGEMVGLLTDRGELNQGKRRYWSHKLDRAAAGIEPFSLPSPEPLRRQILSLELPSPGQIYKLRGDPASPIEEVMRATDDDDPFYSDGVPSEQLDAPIRQPDARRTSVFSDSPDGEDSAVVDLPEVSPTPAISAAAVTTSTFEPVQSAGDAFLPTSEVIRLYEKLDPKYQDSIPLDTFVSELDNNLEYDFSIASKVLQYTKMMQTQVKTPIESGERQATERRGLPESALPVDYQPRGPTNLQRRRSAKARRQSSDLRLTQVESETQTLGDESSLQERNTEANPDLQHSSEQSIPRYNLELDSDWQEIICKQNAERQNKIDKKQEKLPQFRPAQIRKIIQEKERQELRSRFGPDCQDPHIKVWEDLQPSPEKEEEERMEEERIKEHDEALNKTYDKIDEMKRRLDIQRARSEAEREARGRYSEEYVPNRTLPSEVIFNKFEKVDRKLLLRPKQRQRPTTMHQAPRELTWGRADMAFPQRSNTFANSNARLDNSELPQRLKNARRPFSAFISTSLPPKSKSGSQPSSPSPLRKSSLPGIDADDGDDEGGAGRAQSFNGAEMDEMDEMDKTGSSPESDQTVIGAADLKNVVSIEPESHPDSDQTTTDLHSESKGPSLSETKDNSPILANQPWEQDPGTDQQASLDHPSPTTPPEIKAKTEERKSRRRGGFWG